MFPRASISALALLTLGAAPVLGDELDRSAPALGLVVCDAATVLGSHCTTDENGTLWFTLPGGQRFELVTSILDPDIVNPGDGSFHPFDPNEVAAAIRELRFPFEDLAVEIYILPYPRRGAMRSAAGPGLILLSPGVQPLARAHQHAEVIHELGHIVQYARMPDADTERWNAYRNLRGIADTETYAADARHEDRPHEIFAEDFRALFGGSWSNGSGTIENATLVPPASVPGLREFMAGLATPVAAASPLSVFPNPARGAIQLSLRGGIPVPLDLFDSQGRRLMTVEPRQSGASIQWLADPERVLRSSRPQVLFARPRTQGAPAARIIWLP